MERLDIRAINVDLELKSGDLLKVYYDAATARLYYPRIVEWVRGAPFLHLGERVMEVIEPVVVGWDITNEGKAYPPTREHLMEMPIFVLSRIISEIAEDVAA